MFAAQHGLYEIMKFLLEKGADKFHKKNHKLIAIDFAKQNPYYCIVKLLE